MVERSIAELLFCLLGEYTLVSYMVLFSGEGAVQHSLASLGCCRLLKAFTRDQATSSAAFLCSCPGESAVQCMMINDNMTEEVELKLLCQSTKLTRKTEVNLAHVLLLFYKSHKI